MAAEKCVICLLGAMDRLWFHQIILSSEPSLSLFHENPKTPLPASESPNYSSKNSSQMSVISEQYTSPVASVFSTGPQDETSSQESDHDTETTKRLNLVSRKTSSHSSSPVSADKKQSRNLGYSDYSTRRLEKSMSCKSLAELELEEVKGFMDLGFSFKKEKICKRMMSLIPGLQRLDACKNEENYSRDSFEFTCNNDDYEDEEEDEEKKEIMRPYLSEAWLVKRPDSPLLNLSLPKVSTAADMKKHLKCWARTVASSMQLES